ncbi:ABC transporter [Striga asiatica]|uniref:ABC transporter n=1 Tax=Striga asiatica TaxID=4170 RepID=A0A5A7QTD6_STRAF|nr:ABC transporter [Striga asiatica]
MHCKMTLKLKTNLLLTLALLDIRATAIHEEEEIVRLPHQIGGGFALGLEQCLHLGPIGGSGSPTVDGVDRLAGWPCLDDKQTPIVFPSGEFLGGGGALELRVGKDQVTINVRDEFLLLLPHVNNRQVLPRRPQFPAAAAAGRHGGDKELVFHAVHHLHLAVHDCREQQLGRVGLTVLLRHREFRDLHHLRLVRVLDQLPAAGNFFATLRGGGGGQNCDDGDCKGESDQIMVCFREV